LAKAKITVTPDGDHEKIDVEIGKNIYGITTDDGSLGMALDMLIDIILDKEFGLSKHKLLKEVLKVHGIR
jgi:hypothetical protein